jgi:CheY-like chemotaxis protein
MHAAGGSITVRATGGCALREADEAGMGTFVRIEVLDSGCGISPRNLPRVFDPFFTTREVGQGFGLGLSVAHGVVQAHGGEIGVESPAAGGTRVVFYLPQGTREAESLDEAQPVPVPEDGFVLVVDDEPAIVRIAQKCIERRGLRVQTASDGVAALSILRSMPSRIQLLVTDVAMPGLAGDDLLREARALQPGLRALVMSGYGTAIDPARLGDPAITAILPKPFRAADLDAAIESMVSCARSRRAGPGGSCVSGASDRA